MHKRPNLGETIERAQHFQAAGADMILAPGLTRREEIEQLCRSVDCPVAVVVGLSDFRPSLTTFGAIGVRRVIVGSSLARVCYTGILAAVGEMTSAGTFGFTEGLMPFGACEYPVAACASTLGDVIIVARRTDREYQAVLPVGWVETQYGRLPAGR
jgi:2-methylisocitrate lyase-like PEP mutase family enzyme